MTDTVKSYETLGMQYADKYKGLDQRIGLLSLSGVKYMTIHEKKKIGREQTTASDVPYGMKKVKQNRNIRILMLYHLDMGTIPTLRKTNTNNLMVSAGNRQC